MISAWFTLNLICFGLNNHPICKLPDRFVWFVQPGNLLKYHGFHFVTSSVEKQEQALKAEREKVSKEIQEKEKGSADSQNKEMNSDDSQKKEKGTAEVLGKENDTAGNSKEKEVTEVLKTKENPKNMGKADEEKERENQLSAYVAYRIAASAASYLLYHTTNLLPFKSSDAEVAEDLSKDSVGNGMLNNVDMLNGDVASLIATTDSVTSVVAAKEEVKQAVADDLNSTSSTPCEWFVCDDDQTTTRFFVIQVGLGAY